MSDNPELLDDLMNAANAFSASEYVHGRKKKQITLANSLNDLRIQLEKISSRVHAKKPQDDDSYLPRSKSRASESMPSSLVAVVDGDDGKMDYLQLMQELVVVLEDIVSAPSAGQSGGDMAPVDAPAHLEGQEVFVHGGNDPSPLDDGETYTDAANPAFIPRVANTPVPEQPTFGGDLPSDIEEELDESPDFAPHTDEAAIGEMRYPNASYGGDAPGNLDDVFLGNTNMAPKTPAAAVGEMRYPNAAYGGDPAKLAEAFSGNDKMAPKTPATAVGEMRYPNAAYGGDPPAELDQVFNGSTAYEPRTPHRLIVPSTPVLTDQQRLSRGGVIEPKEPDRHFVATRELYGGMAPAKPLGLQPAGAPEAPVVPDIDPQNGDFRVIHIPDH
ncbi:hypothetical protein TetV_653 [Tetraselmis virus 1]|uniref:Uncharacterized protein n=1 Tax=Tetraselmis virus 1 TaxID=2060617 RepID=A0A2P0VP95_9VIRU|nr:hypothetical protein QJ968_gp401 [Tetraselmis virus 1]AUF82735.1 hypothetical protein TetV_653 [Tetraselmis virus 1]